MSSLEFIDETRHFFVLLKTPPDRAESRGFYPAASWLSTFPRAQREKEGKMGRSDVSSTTATVLENQITIGKGDREPTRVLWRSQRGLVAVRT
jgi:hypothetical protein